MSSFLELPKVLLNIIYEYVPAIGFLISGRRYDQMSREELFDYGYTLEEPLSPENIKELVLLTKKAPQIYVLEFKTYLCDKYSFSDIKKLIGNPLAVLFSQQDITNIIFRSILVPNANSYIIQMENLHLYPEQSQIFSGIPTVNNDQINDYSFELYDHINNKYYYYR